MSSTIFRPALPSEKKTILNLYEEARKSGKDRGSCFWPDDYPNEGILDADFKGNNIYVLARGEEIVAAASILETDDLDHEPVGWQPLKSCVPLRVCVSSRHQRQGLGASVMREVMNHARKTGFESIRLLADARNLAANGLYRRLGFAEKGKVFLYGIEFNAYEYVIGRREDAGEG